MKSYLLTGEDYYVGLWRNVWVMGGYSAIFIGVYYGLFYFLGADSWLRFKGQLWLSRSLIVLMAGHLGYVVANKWLETKIFFKKFLFAPGSAYNLAIFRILFLSLLLAAYNSAGQHFTIWAAMPDEARVSLPFMGWFIQNIPITPELYQGTVRVSIVCIYLGIIGFCTRWALLLLLLLSIYVWGVPTFFGKLNHHHIFVWFTAILAFSRCADVLSLDSWTKQWWGKKIKIQAHAAYGLPFAFIFLLFGHIYVFAGIWKMCISGFDWALTDSMVHQIRKEWVEHYRWLPAFRIDHYPGLCKLLGLGVIFMELLYPLLILAPKTRILAALGGLSLHQGAGYFMKIGFEDLQKSYVAYINWQGIFDWIMSKTGLDKWFLLWKKWSFFKKKSVFIPVYNLKPLLFVGGSLVIVNLFFGLFNVHSFPFSPYPNYASLVTSEIETIEFYPTDSLGKPMPVDAYAQVHHFRKENIIPYGEAAIWSYYKGDTLKGEEQLRAYWNLWQQNIPILQLAKKVDIVYEKRPLQPEKWADVIEQKVWLRLENSVPPIKKSAKNDLLVPPSICAEQLPTAQELILFKQFFDHLPQTIEEVFLSLGDPTSLSNHDWILGLALICIELNGQPAKYKHIGTGTILSDIFPLFATRLSSYFANKTQPQRLVYDLLQWACKEPEKVAMAKKYYAVFYQKWQEGEKMSNFILYRKFIADSDCLEQLPTEAQVAVFEQSAMFPPTTREDVFIAFGLPGAKTSSGWMAFVAVLQAEAIGKAFPQFLYAIQPLVDTLAPSFPRKMDYYQGKKASRYLGDIQQWACEYPNEVNIVEQYYGRMYDEWVFGE